MNKRYLVTSVVVVIATLFVVAGIYAGTKVTDEIKWKTRRMLSIPRAYKLLPI